MKSRLVLFSTLTFVFAAFLISQKAVAQYGGDTVAEPEFHFKDGTTHSAGKCFALRWHNKNLLMMPLHLLSPAGGYPSAVPIEQVNSLVDHVDAMSLQSQSVLDTARHNLLNQRSSLCGDTLAFELPSSTRLSAFSLCRTLPAKGTRVAVLSKDQVTNSSQANRYVGTVAMGLTSALIVQLDQPLTAHASSGAPVVDGNNELVGMLVGTQGAERKIIQACPCTALDARLSREIR